MGVRMQRCFCRVRADKAEWLRACDFVEWMDCGRVELRWCMRCIRTEKVHGRKKKEARRESQEEERRGKAAKKEDVCEGKGSMAKRLCCKIARQCEEGVARHLFRFE